MTMPQGSIRIGLDWDSYEAAEAENFSLLKNIARSPAHYLHARNAERVDKAVFAQGRATHFGVFEPERLASEIAVFDGPRRAGKEWERFKAQADALGQTILKEAEFEECIAYANAVRSNQTAMGLLQTGIAEVSITWRDEVTGIVCKGRLDWVTRGKWITDLKTTKCAAPEEFARQSWRYLYHVQGAMYVDGWKAVTGEELPFLHIAVEKESPYVVQVYRLPEYVIQAGRETYREWLALVKRCRESGEWPGYADGVVELQPPRWALDSDEDDLSDLGLEFGAA